jgi:hypothetical protein
MYIQESAREDVEVLSRAVDAAVTTLNTLSTANLQDTVERTWVQHIIIHMHIILHHYFYTNLPPKTGTIGRS